MVNGQSKGIVESEHTIGSAIVSAFGLKGTKPKLGIYDTSSA